MKIDTSLNQMMIEHNLRIKEREQKVIEHNTEKYVEEMRKVQATSESLGQYVNVFA